MLFGTKRRLDGLEDSLERLENRFKSMELAWQDTQDKLLRAMARVVKTRQRMEELEKATNGEQEPAGTPHASPSMHGGLLTPRQKEIQQQILRRRAGGG